MAHTIRKVESLSTDSTAVSTGEPTILLIGSAMLFSDRFLSVLRSEFTDCRFQRVSALADVAVARRLNNLRLLILDEDHIPALLQNPDTYFDAAKDASIVLACTEDQVAANFLSARPESGLLDQVGLLPLNAQMDIWISVMQLLLCGQNFIGQNLLREIQTPTAQGEPVWEAENPAHLTPRELQVLELVASGRQNKCIALELDLSLHTVKLHIHNILQKTEQSNRTGAANWFMQMNNNGKQLPHANHG